MTKEEWDALPDAKGPVKEDWNVMPDKGSAGRRLSSPWWTLNIENICSSDPVFIVLNPGMDSAECSGLNNKKGPTTTLSYLTYPRCDAFLEDDKYYETETTLGIGCLNHDACLQKGGPEKKGPCNDDCLGCNPGYQRNLPGDWDCT